MGDRAASEVGVESDLPEEGGMDSESELSAHDEQSVGLDGSDTDSDRPVRPQRSTKGRLPARFRHDYVLERVFCKPCLKALAEHVRGSV